MARRRTPSTPVNPKTAPKAPLATAKAMAKIRTALQPTPVHLSASPNAPSGKLGMLVERASWPMGATIGELADVTGWQAHTIRAAFCRLRQRGFPIAHEIIGEGRKAYRLEQKEG